MFKEGEYIICLNTPIKETSYPRNYIFKQRKDERFLLSVINGEGHNFNGWGAVKFDNSGKYSEWKYAISEEIEEYNRINKPYDVTTLIIPEIEVVNENLNYMMDLLKKLNIN